MSCVSGCPTRDIGRMYRAAQEGEISNFTGIAAPYEQPFHHKVEVDTGYQIPGNAFPVSSRA